MGARVRPRGYGSTPTRVRGDTPTRICPHGYAHADTRVRLRVLSQQPIHLVLVLHGHCCMSQLAQYGQPHQLCRGEHAAFRTLRLHEQYLPPWENNQTVRESGLTVQLDCLTPGFLYAPTEIPLHAVLKLMSRATHLLVPFFLAIAPFPRTETRKPLCHNGFGVFYPKSTFFRPPPYS